MIRRKYLIFFAALISVLCITNILYSSNTFASETDHQTNTTTSVGNENNENDSEEEDSDTPYISESDYLQNISKAKSISASDLVSAFKSKQDFVLFIGYKECPYCRKFSQVFKQFTENYDATPIYYLNTKGITSEQLTPEFRDILINKLKLQYVPTTVFIQNGNITKYFDDGSETTLAELESIKSYLHNPNNQYNNPKKAEVSNTTPVQANNTTPVQANNTTPVQANNTTPVQANNTTPVQANNTTPVQANNTTPVQANNTTPVQTDNTDPIKTTNLTNGLDKNNSNNFKLPPTHKKYTTNNAINCLIAIILLVTVNILTTYNRKNNN